jgi:hypothetical protein
MTALTRIVKRECPRTFERGRTIILELRPGDIIAVRAKGRRTTYETTVGAVFALAARTFGNEQKRLKAEKRKAARA